MTDEPKVETIGYFEEVPHVACLNHGYVRLVDHMGSDLSVVRAARVSYDAAWRAGHDEKSDSRLIKYLWKHKHSTPFEAVTFTFEVKAPIFVLRQWHRHRTWSYNELSARYRELSEEYYLPKIEEIGVQSTDNKQTRTIGELTEQERHMKAIELDSVENCMMKCFSMYRSLLSAGWPRELARSVLPVATFSNMFATVNLLNLLKFATLRTHPHAQAEIRQYAAAMMQLIKPIVPVCYAAWEASND